MLLGWSDELNDSVQNLMLCILYEIIADLIEIIGDIL